MAKTNSTLTAERVRELLDYDPETGGLTWRTRPSNRVRIGDKAGCVRLDRRITVRVDGAFYKAHRIAWLHFYGIWPRDQIDHRDGDPSNNCIRNLRDVNQPVNMQNLRKARIDSQTKLLGVCVDKKRRSFAAQIKVNGKRMHLGVFNTAAEAHAAYIQAKRRLHEGCTI